MVAEALLENAPDKRSRAHLLMVSSRERELGAWLQAAPVSSLLRSWTTIPFMDDNTFKVAVGLRLGSSLCGPHSCYHCGTEVDRYATHGLSCHWSEGHHYRHAAINDVVHCLAKIPSRLEPSGIYSFDGKRTSVPWERGKLLFFGYHLLRHLRSFLHLQCSLWGQSCGSPG